MNFKPYKNKIKNLIDEYDRSSSVNVFYINDEPLWIPRETRVSLMNTANIKRSLNDNEITLWDNGKSYDLECDQLILMLKKLEQYAFDCFNTTAKHKKIVDSLEDFDKVINYNYKSGYPEPLHFTL